MESTLREMTFQRHGLSTEEGELSVKVARELREQYDTTAVRRIATLVKKAFESIRRTDCSAYHIYRGLALDPIPDKQAKELASLAYQALGRASMQIEKQADGTFRRFLTGIAPTLSGAVQTFGMAGALAGVPVGAGLWLTNRGLGGQDKQLRELEIQRDTYGRLAAEVEDELKRRNLDATPANVAATVDYLT